MKFEFQYITIKGSKLKLTADFKPTIIIVNNKLAIICYFKNDQYHISSISDHSEYNIKTIKLTVSNNNITSTANLSITSGKNIKFLDLHKSLGYIFILNLKFKNKLIRN